MAIEDNCPQCLIEKSKKRHLTAECGVIEDWLERMKTDNNKESLTATWTIANTIDWNRQDMQKLGFTYMDLLANFISMEMWELPFKGVKSIGKRFRTTRH